MVGIDVGLIDFFVTSDNESIAAPKYLRKSEGNSSQHKGKCPEERKGSKGRQKAIKQLAKNIEK